MRCRHCGGEIDGQPIGPYPRHAVSLAMGCTGMDTFAEPTEDECPAPTTAHNTAYRLPIDQSRRDS